MDRLNARLMRQNRAKKVLWWWRYPYAIMIVATAILLFLRFDGMVGLLLSVAIGGMGLGVLRVDPWRGRGAYRH